MKTYRLQNLCDMLNALGTCSFLLKDVKVTKAAKKLCEFGPARVRGSLRAEVDGVAMEFEFEAKDFKVLDHEAKEV